MMIGSRAQFRRLVFIGVFVALCTGPAAYAQAEDMRECDLTFTGQIPLPDGGGLFYRRVGLVPEYATTSGGADWRSVGLYGNGQTARPDAHELAGLAQAQQVQPLDGKIVMISVGMSNTNQEFNRFRARAQNAAIRNPALVLVNGAQGGQPADAWDTPTEATWDRVDALLTQQGLTPAQVQVAWIKHAVRSPMHPPLDFPAHPENLRGLLQGIVTSLKIRYPNVRLAYLSSRTRAYNSSQAAQSPEPHAYEGGFAVQWLIEQQIQGDPALRYDGANPPAPWLSWGPYLWTDGMGAASTDPPAPFEARSDGYVWTCSDVQDDGVHPSPPTPGPGPADGEFKTGDQLMAFFRTDVTATPWFLRSTSGGPAIVSLTANGQDVTGGGTITGAAPFSVDFAVSGSGAVHEVVWTYDDGTFSFNPLGTSNGQPYFDDLAAPHKVFKSPGTFDVRVHISDTSGDVTLAGVTVEVTGGTLCGGGPALALSRFAGTATAVLTWCAVPNADSFNVYRGSRPDLADLACFASGLTAATTTDADSLPPDSLRVYLVTSVSGGVESGLGNASIGQPRVNPAPCP